jgi:hypothetical protein
MTSRELLAGPRVATILVRRMVSNKQLRRENSSGKGPLSRCAGSALRISGGPARSVRSDFGVGFVQSRASFQGVPPEHQPAPDPRLSVAECYTILRGQLQHEDNLITQRLSWLMGSQAFLFTAYAIVLNGPERPKTALIGSLQDYLLGTLPAVGLLSAALIYVSIIAGALAMFSLYRSAGNLCGDGAAGFPPLGGRKLERYMGFASPFLLPPIFITVWLLLWSHGLSA